MEWIILSAIQPHKRFIELKRQVTWVEVGIFGSCEGLPHQGMKASMLKTVGVWPRCCKTMSLSLSWCISILYFNFKYSWINIICNFNNLYFYLHIYIYVCERECIYIYIYFQLKKMFLFCLSIFPHLFYLTNKIPLHDFINTPVLPLLG